MIVFNLNPILEQFSSANKGIERICHPFHVCNTELSDKDYDALVDKYKKKNKHFERMSTVDLGLNKLIIWKAHQDPIIDTKLIQYNGFMLLTLSQSCCVKLWTLKGEMLGQIFVNDVKKSEVWNV